MSENTPPFFSVIIPSFNAERTISECLQSIAEQNFKDYEVIVCDGNSSDKTGEIALSFSDRVKKLNFCSEKDEGIYDAINKGIKKAKGEWICILGSDDRLFESSTLQKAHEYLSPAKKGVMYGNVMVKGDAGWAADGTIYDGEFSLEKLLQKNICQQAVFYHRSVFEKVGYFNNTYAVCADWDHILRCAASVEMTFTPLTIATFTGGGTSKTASEQKFYEDLPGNLFRYFGWKIFRKDFAVVAWRFKEYAKLQKSRGRSLSAFFYNLVERKHR